MHWAGIKTNTWVCVQKIFDVFWSDSSKETKYYWIKEKKSKIQDNSMRAKVLHQIHYLLNSLNAMRSIG